MRVCSEEVFAPVVVIEPFDGFEKAVDMVNSSRYGLQAGVFTRDIKKAFFAFENIETGGVVINDVPTFRTDNMPYGGIKESGFGREGVKYAIEEMTERKTMVVNLEAAYSSPIRRGGW
jgi:glyceraldehyde-3-phosphate dehydrogenase (NADP+)